MVTEELRIILVFLTSFVSVVFLIPKLGRIAARIGLVDQPGIRKVHRRPLPLVGGIAMVISVTFSCLLFVPLGGLRGFFLGMAVLLLVGFLDDYREIGHREKFLAQILSVSMLFYFSTVSLLSFGDLLGIGSFDLPGVMILVWGVTVFCLVGVVNSINLLDGLDGLAGGFCFQAFFAFAVLASISGATTAVLINLALVGAVMGFLRFNWGKATVFMGDAGSLSLGFALGFMALLLTQGEEAVIRPVSALLILAVPIVDTLTVMGKRIIRGQSPFRPDKYHLHHIFIRYGMAKDMAVGIILLLAVAFSCLSIAGEIFIWPEWVLFFIFSAYFIAYVTSSFYIVSLMRISRKLLRHHTEEGKGSVSNWFNRLTTPIREFRFFRYMRKTVRYPVEMKLECSPMNEEERYVGTVLNISSGGLMADIADLQQLLGHTILKITFELDGNEHTMELPANHIWLSKKENGCSHGFAFLEFDGNQDSVIFKLLVKSKEYF